MASPGVFNVRLTKESIDRRQARNLTAEHPSIPSRLKSSSKKEELSLKLSCIYVTVS